MFDDDFIKSLPQDDIDAIVMLCNTFRNKVNSSSILKISDFQEAYASVSNLSKKLDLKVQKIDFTGNDELDQSLIKKYISTAARKAKEVQRKRVIGNCNERFVTIRYEYEYEFSDNDFKKIQDYINELRNLISNNEELTENHIFRLLKRLEQFQSELHKRVTNLDRALGFLLDVSIIVKQTGEGAKPIADIAKEISKILTQVILVSKGLPPGELPPLLK